MQQNNQPYQAFPLPLWEPQTGFMIFYRHKKPQYQNKSLKTRLELILKDYEKLCQEGKNFFERKAMEVNFRIQQILNNQLSGHQRKYPEIDIEKLIKKSESNQTISLFLFFFYQYFDQLFFFLMIQMRLVILLLTK
ncbi:hypothetical protein pb186bvf_017565 [Paramecium bursaria]